MSVIKLSLHLPRGSLFPYSAIMQDKSQITVAALVQNPQYNFLFQEQNNHTHQLDRGAMLTTEQTLLIQCIRNIIKKANGSYLYLFLICSWFCCELFGVSVMAALKSETNWIANIIGIEPAFLIVYFTTPATKPFLVQNK